MGKFSILVPPDYYAVRNVKVGYVHMPLFLISYDEYGHVLILRVIYAESSNPEETIYTFYYDFKRGLDQSAPHALYTEPQFFENDKNGLKIVAFNMTTNINGIDTFSSQAIIKSYDEILLINYLSDDKDLFDFYYYEFENMVWSTDYI